MAQAGIRRVRDPGAMTADTNDWPHEALWLDAGELLVELPTRHLAESLCDRLEPTFVARPDLDHDVWVVDVLFGNSGALARLLRTIEDWVTERPLGAVRYHLDGKAYVLSAGEIAWSSFGAEPEWARALAEAAARRRDSLGRRAADDVPG